MNVILATFNQHKAIEIRQMLLELDIHIETLEDIDFQDEIIEDCQTFWGNALKKAKTVGDKTGSWVLADDSGLCVPALHGNPGVWSARYAGKDATDAQNNEKLLTEMKVVDKREGYFHCSMVLYKQNTQVFTTIGEIHGKILDTPQGSQGFGYDPLFWIPEKSATMAELSMDEKNKISHRRQALTQMKSILETL